MAEKQENYFIKSRVETFSDGIFAIIVTLLVLEIKTPKLGDPNSVIELTQALWLLLPKILSWMVSFLIVCVIWVNHHRIFEQLKLVTHSFFWLNANLLLWCSFIPFPTALMGDFLSNPMAQAVFGLILAMMSFSFTLMRFNVLKNVYVLNDNVDVKQYRLAARRSFFFGPVLYLLGAASSFIHPYIAFAIYFFIPLYFIFSNGIKPKANTL
jgi:uncharacterized membrane protein